MVSNESEVSVQTVLQIVTDSLSESVVLKRDLEQYILNTTGRLVQKCSKLELENQKLKDENAELKQKLDKYESVSTVSQSTNSQELKQLQEAVASTTNGLVVQVNTSRSTWDGELLKYNEVYTKCKEDLEKLNLKISDDIFDRKFKEYRKTCERHDNDRKEAFKLLYEIDMQTRDKLEKEKEQNSKYFKEMESFVEDVKHKLNKIRELVVSFLNKEKKVYEDALYHGKRETAWYSNLLTNHGNKYKNESVIPTAKASAEANAKVESSSDKRSIILLNFPSNNLSEILDFLNSFSTELNLKKGDVEITNAFDGRIYSKLRKITLPSAEFVDKIFREEHTIKADFNGISVCLYEYKKCKTMDVHQL